MENTFKPLVNMKPSQYINLVQSLKKTTIYEPLSDSARKFSYSHPEEYWDFLKPIIKAMGWREERFRISMKPHTRVIFKP